MGLIASLPEIDQKQKAVFVMHERSEKLIPLHKHTKGQLSYVEDGIAYITVDFKTYVVPARHYFWIPKGIQHVLRIGYSATALRSLYFYAHDDGEHPFYSKLGIYPASELLIQMINYTERWDGRNIDSNVSNFEFLIAIKKVLPSLNHQSLSLVLPTTDNEHLLKIMKYLERNIDAGHSLRHLLLGVGMSGPGPISFYFSETATAMNKLKKEHQENITLCMNIRKGFLKRVSTERIKKYVDWYWEVQLLPHFNSEERVIFPILGKKHALVKRAMSEHRKLRRLFQSNTELDKTLNRIEEELEAHIRFEERVLFVELEKLDDECVLSAIDTLHQGHKYTGLQWEDEFWK